MNRIAGKAAIQNYYEDEAHVRQYLDERISHPLGRIYHDAQVKFVNDVIDRFSVGKMLEIAPGPARISAEVNSFVEAVLLERSRPMLDVCKQRLWSRKTGQKWQMVQGDAFHLPWTSAFHFVYSFRFIRHFEEADRTRLYEEIHRALHRKGLFVFDAVNKDVSLPMRVKAPDQFRVYDKLYKKEDLVEELKLNGFRVLKTRNVYANYNLQSWIQENFVPRWRLLGEQLINLIEQCGSHRPLEWIVLCQKI